MIGCPHCGSPRTASRRQLFLCLMHGRQQLPGFTWYRVAAPRAMPPKSLFVQCALLAASCVALLCTLAFAGVVHPLTLVDIALGASGALIASLVLDVLFTYRRYRDWAGEWLCADCRCRFRALEQLTGAN